jgi:alpha-amylase
MLDSVDTLVEYIEGLGTQFSCFDSCLQGESRIASQYVADDSQL